MDSNITITAAFGAGLLSFLSPCVLPLFGSYLAFISGTRAVPPAAVSAAGAAASGTAAGTAAVSARNLYTVICALFFVLGFSVVFAALGILLYGFFLFLSGWTTVLNIAAGIIVIVFGLNIIFGFIPFLKYDDSGERCETCAPGRSFGFKFAAGGGASGGGAAAKNRQKNFLGAFVVGMAFGAGWTPCVSAFLGSVLLMASQSSTMLLAAFCLMAYSAGLGVPFLIVSFFWASLMEKAARYGRFLPAVKWISGLFLTAVGVCMLLGRMPALNAALSEALNAALQSAAG